jgi:hypothetical protein
MLRLFVIHVFLFTLRGNLDVLMTVQMTVDRGGCSPRYPFVDPRFTSYFAFKARKARTFKALNWLPYFVSSHPSLHSPTDIFCPELSPLPLPLCLVLPNSSFAPAPNVVTVTMAG